MPSKRKLDSKFPEWDGSGNKYEWILDNAARLRAQQTGRLDALPRPPKLTLYINRTLTDVGAKK